MADIHAMAKRLNLAADRIAERAPEDNASLLRAAADCINTLYTIKEALQAHIEYLKATHPQPVTPAGGEVYSGDAFDAWFERNGFPANTKRMRSLAFEYGWRAAKAAHPPVADAALDSARMDWADKNLADFSRGHSTVHYALSNQGKTSVGHTFREVIDQAMQDAALNQRGTK